VSRASRVGLGCIHLTIGLAILALRYFGGADLFQALLSLSAEIPTWALFATAAIKAVYGIGTYLPGTTVILLNMLGRDCSTEESSKWLLAVWVGVLVGISISYTIGWLLSANKQEKRFHWLDLLFGSHPNLTSVYFFERGYWQRSVVYSICIFAVFGFVFLALYAFLICGFKSVVREQAQEIGVLWGLFMVFLGAWRIGESLLDRPPPSSMKSTEP
jgi:hypothetical protein